MSTSTYTLMDPTPETAPTVRPRREPPASLAEGPIALLDIGKSRGNVFLDRLEQRLAERGYEVRRYAKPTNTKVAPDAVVQAIATECRVVVEALSDWGSCTSCSVHDILELDRRGIPGGMIATTVFEPAAKAQGASLSFEPAVVYVPHPIQDRTDEELWAIADAAVGPVLRMLGQAAG